MKHDTRQQELFAAPVDVRPVRERSAADRYREPSLLDAIREAACEPEGAALYRQIVLCAADDVQQLRRSDVHRVIAEAQEHGVALAFTKWLSFQLPQYGWTISEAYAEVTGIIIEAPAAHVIPRRA